jgi:hypothetical protein
MFPPLSVSWLKVRVGFGIQYVEVELTYASKASLRIAISSLDSGLLYQPVSLVHETDSPSLYTMIANIMSTRNGVYNQKYGSIYY